MFENIFGGKKNEQPEQPTQEQGQPWTDEAPEMTQDAAEEMELNTGRSAEEISRIQEEEGVADMPEDQDDDMKMAA